MDLFNFSSDPFEFIESEGLFLNSEKNDELNFTDELEEILSIPIANPRQLHSSPLRPIDLPSYRKHYGLLTFYQFRIPILFRLSANDYVPYVRFSYALNILDQYQSNQSSPILDMVKNLPILEMSSIEMVYYDRLMQALSSTITRLPDHHVQWSNRLLSVALLDCLLGILDCSTSVFQTNNIDSSKWEQIVEVMRQEVKSRWTIEEKFVLNQVEKQTRQSHHDSEPLCISSTNIAQRRLFLEKHLDLSIVENSGGFVQIDSFIFPYIKSLKDNRIYLNVNDIQTRFHQYLLLPSIYFRCFSSDSSIAHAYSIICEQARENFFWNSIHGSVSMSKRLPNPKNLDVDLRFVSLDVFLQSKGMCFVQLFEKSSLEFLTTNYQNQFGRQFIIGDCSRQGGFINQEIPFLRLRISHLSFRTWIPTESQSARLMTNDERLFLNCMLLYQNHWNAVLNKDKRWFFEELDMDIQSSIMYLFDQEYYERQQRKLLLHC